MRQPDAAGLGVNSAGSRADLGGTVSIMVFAWGPARAITARVPERPHGIRAKPAATARRAPRQGPSPILKLAMSWPSAALRILATPLPQADTSRPPAT